MLPFFAERFGNPSSHGHVFGEEAREAVERARRQVAALIGAAPEEIIFTSGATESDNLALRGCLRPGQHLMTTSIEHPAVLEPARTLERSGVEVTRIGTDSSGVIRVEDIESARRPNTVFLSLMAANNEVGTLQPLAEAANLCRKNGIFFHCDAVQALGRIPIHVRMGFDLMSLSAHKMYGPKGIGALYIRRRRPPLRLSPQSQGGGQERGLRAGTLNVPAIVGFGEAARLAQQALETGEPQRLLNLRDRLLSGLRSRLDGVEVNGDLSRRLPGNLHVSVLRAEAETLILSLGGEIAISSGAACAEEGGKGSHVLRALGLSDERIYTGLRFGLGRYNTEAEVDVVVERVAEAATRARARAGSAIS